MQITLDIKDERINDLLTTAFEGGANYWIRRAHLDQTPEGKEAADRARAKYTADYCLVPGNSVTIEINPDSPKDKTTAKSRIDRESIAAGLVLMATKFGKHFGDFMAGNEDAATGDVFLQCVVLHDVIYG